jgi:hypothetical protein
MCEKGSALGGGLEGQRKNAATLGFDSKHTCTVDGTHPYSFIGHVIVIIIIIIIDFSISISIDVRN